MKMLARQRLEIPRHRSGTAFVGWHCICFAIRLQFVRRNIARSAPKGPRAPNSRRVTMSPEAARRDAGSDLINLASAAAAAAQAVLRDATQGVRERIAAAGRAP